MRKTAYYNFLMTKEEEIKAAKSGNAIRLVSYELVEIRDLDYHPPFKTREQWHILKVIEPEDIRTGILQLSWRGTFDHIFRYWDVETSNAVINGKKIYVAILDVTVPGRPMTYQENIYLQKKSNEYVYDFGMKALIDDKFLKDDLIGLTWNSRDGIFQTRLLSRGGNAARDAICLE